MFHIYIYIYIYIRKLSQPPDKHKILVWLFEPKLTRTSTICHWNQEILLSYMNVITIFYIKCIKPKGYPWKMKCISQFFCYCFNCHFVNTIEKSVIWTSYIYCKTLPIRQNKKHTKANALTVHGIEYFDNLLGLYSLRRHRLMSYQYRDPHHKPKMVWRLSQVYNGNPYTHKTTSS